MISVRQPVVGKHMSVKPAVRKTHEAGGAGRSREGRRIRKKDGGNEQNKKWGRGKWG